MTSPSAARGRSSTVALPPLHTRKPTCKTAWPRIALPGPGGSGKSWELARFSGSPRVGRTLWLQLAESTADEYGLVPGADFEILNHDGSYQSIMTELRAAKAHAQAAVAAGERPWVIGVDTVSAFWDMLKAWADGRARQSDSARAKLRRDPNADIKVSMNIWEDVARRWKEFMGLLFSGPWILVMLAKGKLVVAMGEDGRPDPDTPKQYRIEARAGFDHDAAQIVRMSPDEPPLVVKLRTVHNGIRPGVEQPESCSGFSLEWLVFERLKFDPANAEVPEDVHLDGGGLTDTERVADEEGESPGRQRHTPVGLTTSQLAAVEERGAEWVHRFLELSDVDTAAEKATAIGGHWSAAADIIRFVDTDVRERLGVRPDTTSLTYGELTKLGVAYIGKHKRSPLAPLDEPTPSREQLLAEAGTARAALEEHADELAAAAAAREPEATTSAPPADEDDLTESAFQLFHALMACETVEQVDEITRSEILGNPVAQVDISRLLVDEARETLGIREGTYSLGALAHMLRTYTEQHHRSPAVRLDGQVA